MEKKTKKKRNSFEDVRDYYDKRITIAQKEVQLQEMRLRSAQLEHELLETRKKCRVPEEKEHGEGTVEKPAESAQPAESQTGTVKSD